MNRLSGKQIKSNILMIGLWTCFGRILGLAKDMLLASFLGIGATTDAFLLAFRIPNMLRTTFAEGSIPGALIPTASILLSKGRKDRVQRLLAILVSVLALIGLILWVLVLIWPAKIINLVAAGLDPLRMGLTGQYLKILFPFLIIISLCSVIGSVLQAANHFTIQAAGPPILNVIWAASLILAIYFNLSVFFICLSVVFAAFAKLLTRSIVLWHKELLPKVPTRETLSDFLIVLKRFIPLGFGMFLTLANTIIETQTASFLQVGQISLIHYAFRIFNLPLNTIAIPITNVLLPQISKIADANSNRLSFYFLQTIKLVVWTTIPISILVIWNSNFIIQIILGAKSTPEQLTLASNLLKILCIGLFFSVFNRAMNSFFYALHDTKTPTIIWGFSILVNAIGNYLSVFVFNFGVYGIFISTVISWAIITPVKIFILKTKHNLQIPLIKIARFLAFFALNITCITVLTIIFIFFLDKLFLLNQVKTLFFIKKTLIMGLSFLIFYCLIWQARGRKTCTNLKCYFLD